MAHNTASGFCLFDRGEEVGDKGVITDGKGTVIGGTLIVARWQARWDIASEYICQVEARINGVLYTGRTRGHNCIWHGKIKKEKSNA